MPTYPTRHPHAQLSPTILHEPQLYGYAQLHEEFNYNVMPLAPPGTQVIIHEKPTVRDNWTPYGVKGWYLGPSMNHYRCHHVYVKKTRGERESDCVDFFLHNTPLPYKYSAENAIIVAQELAYALQNPAPQAPFSNIGKSKLVAIETLYKIFFKVDNEG